MCRPCWVQHQHGVVASAARLVEMWAQIHWNVLSSSVVAVRAISCEARAEGARVGDAGGAATNASPGEAAVAPASACLVSNIAPTRSLTTAPAPAFAVTSAFTPAKGAAPTAAAASATTAVAVCVSIAPAGHDVCTIECAVHPADTTWSVG